MGPQHPSTHGVLRIKLRLDGEVVLSAEPVIGYLHTGVEKECETAPIIKSLPLSTAWIIFQALLKSKPLPRAVERLMKVEVPERAQTIRLILLSFPVSPVILSGLGTSALELNMSSVFMYCFAEREKILDLFEEMSGARMFPSCWRIGGLAYDLNPEFEANVRSFLKSISPHLERSGQSADR